MNTVKTAPQAAINQIEHVLKRLILAEAPEDAEIFMAKWDVKDGFWQLNNEQGDEYNFSSSRKSQVQHQRSSYQHHYKWDG